MTEENEIQKKSNRSDQLSMAIVITALIAVVMTLISFANYESQFRAKPMRLTLMAVGCEYVRQHSSLTPIMNVEASGCEVDAHFVPSMIGSGGVIFYGADDERSLTIADAVVVGVISIWEPMKPWNHRQKRAGFLFLVSLMFLMVMLFVMSAVPKSRNE